MQTLQKRLITPDQKITATWSRIDKRIIYAACGLKWPKHPTTKDGTVKPPYKQIRNYTGKDLTDLEKQLISFQRFVGITTLCGDVEMESNLTYLQDFFSDFNLLEFELAYVAGTEGLLNLTDRERQHYDALTPSFLKPMLSAYRYYRQKLLNKHANIELEASLEQIQSTKPEPTPAEQLAFDKQFVILAFNNITSGIGAIGLNKIYDILYKYNLITFSEDRKKAFHQAAVDAITRDSKKDTRAKTVIQAFDQNLEFGTTNVLQEAKRIAIRTLFYEMREQEVAPEQMFEGIEPVIPSAKINTKVDSKDTMRDAKNNQSQPN